MKRLILAMTGLALVAAACGSGGAVAVRKVDSGRTAGPSLSANQSSTPSQPPTSPSTPPGTAQTVTVEVWFTKGETLFESKRTQSFTVAVGRAALTALLAGPSADEKAAGLASSVPTGTQLSGLSIADGIATDSPVIGAAVSSPVAISGTADVFEAVVSYRILDENGKVVAQGTTMASCGTGCRGDFSVHVSYVVAHDQQGTIELFEASAKDGSPTNVVDVPVT